MAKKSPLFPDNKYQNKGERINKAKKKKGGIKCSHEIDSAGNEVFPSSRN